MKITIYLLTFFWTFAAQASSENISTANLFKGPETGIIEITGNAAQFVYERMEQVEEKAAFAESTKIGSGIRCSKFGFESTSKNNPAKKSSYKCLFKIDKKGSVTAPAELK